MSTENIRIECTVLYHMVNCGAIDLGAMAPEFYKKVVSTKTADEFFDLEVFKNNQDVNTMMISKLSGKNEANNAPPCRSCGSDRYYVDLQRRSGDEERNYEIHCPSCGSVQKSVTNISSTQ